MKYSAFALSTISLLLLAGCFDQDANKTLATSSAAATSPVKKISLTNYMPANIKGAPSEVAGRCAVDIVNYHVKDEVVAINRTDGLNIYGWALDENSTSVPPVVILHLLKGTESYYGQLNRRADRGDLVKAFNNPEFINAGYGGAVDISLLPVGLYEIRIIQKGENKNLACSTDHKIELRD